MRVLLATANEHKLQEIQSLLSNLAIELVGLRDFPTLEMPEETGATMRENARLKAEHCCAVSGLPALADDSGIEVDALGGAPGVRSARWMEGSDHDRTQGLLDRLSETPEKTREARYRCAICLAFPDGRLLETEGTCEGRISHEFRGENGFGYDPVFEITEQTGASSDWVGKTMAEAPPELKARVSHRARALMELREKLR